MARIILIDPRGWQGAASGQPAYPNIGLAYLAPVLQKCGYQVCIIDLNNQPVHDTQVVKVIKNFSPDLIGFSVKTATIKGARILAEKIKAALPKLPVIFGGPHATLCWSDLITKNWCDIVFNGEGEEVISELCQRLVLNKSIDNLSGVITKENFKNTSRLNPVFVANLDNLLSPTYNLFPKNVQNFIRRAYPLSTSRGCVYGCTYCSVPKISGRKFRRRSPENIIKELEQAIKIYNIKRFEIIDDVFNLDTERCKEICRELISHRLNLYWSCPNGLRADRVDQELAELMFQAGCRSVSVGIESADPKVFTTINKGGTLETIRKGIEIFKGAGLQVIGFFIIGLPGDSLKSQKQSLKFIKEMRISALFNLLVPYPETKVWQWAKAHARFIGDVENSLHFADGVNKLNVAIETDDFSAAERLQAYEMVHVKLGQIGLLVPKTLPKIQYCWHILKLLWKYNRLNLLDHFYTFKMILKKIKNKICQKYEENFIY